MKLFQSKEERIKSALKLIMPAAGLVLVILIFVLAIGAASDSSLSSQKASLERALTSGAVRTYALTGAYPQSLDELLETYRITYDKDKYIVEYVPQGANLVPSIFVIPLAGSKE